MDTKAALDHVVETRRTSESEDWYTVVGVGPWSLEDAAHYAGYWNGEHGWYKFRAVPVEGKADHE